jgi:type II secretory pathway component PulF
MGQAARDIEGGGTLSESLAKHPKVFPTLYTNMIRAGEASGQLEKIFTRLGELVEHESETREKIKSALRYPKMVLGALVVAFIIIMTFVVPRFTVVFAKFKIALPLPTKIMIAINAIIQGYWVFLVGIVVLSIIFTRWFITTSLGRYYWHYLQIKLYVVGSILQKAALSRFAHILGTLIQSGLPIIENLHITSMAVGNDVISGAVRKIRDGVQAGKGLAESMKDITLFTPLVVQMIAIGETTGELDTMLLKVSRYYDMEVDYGTKKLSSYIEPLLTLALGMMVLFFALAVFMPMWDLTKIAGAGR